MTTALISVTLLVRLPWWGQAAIRLAAWAVAYLPGGWRLWPTAVWIVERVLQATRVEFVKDDRAVVPAGVCLACGAVCNATQPICSACEKAGWP